MRVRFFLETEHTYRLNPRLKLKVATFATLFIQIKHMNRCHLQEALSSQQKSPWDKPKLGKDKKAPSLALLEEHAHTKWNSILHFIVHPTGRVHPAESVKHTLREATRS